MIEKVKNTPLGNMPFSEFLKQTRPNFTQLIELEQARENMTNIIYDNYLEYCELLKDKTTAISFEQFAHDRYNIDNIDIPINYEETKETRKK